MKFLNRSLVALLVSSLVFTLLVGMPAVRVAAEPVVATDLTEVCSDAPAGMKTVIKDTNNGYLSVTLKLIGSMNINSFSWAISYDKAKVVPVTADTKVDAPNEKLATAAAIAPYYEIVGASRLEGYNIASFQIENTTAATTGNYLLISYTKIGGASISLDGTSEVSMLKMMFRVIDEIDEGTFGYFHKTSGGTVVSKLVYGTTNVLQHPTSAGATIFARPDLFTTEIKPFGYPVCLTSLSAADHMNTGDVVYDDYMNGEGCTTFSIKSSYQSPHVIATTEVDAVTKAAALPLVEEGTYLLTVSRKGYLSREITVTVDGGTVDLGDKSILAGDIYVDGIIDGSDSEILFSTLGSRYEDPTFLPEHDLNSDGMIDGTDTEMLFANLGSDAGAYGEIVDYGATPTPSPTATPSPSPEPMAAVPNRLWSKKVTFMGDSITMPGNSYAAIIGTRNRMTVENGGNAGGALSSGFSGKNFIISNSYDSNKQTLHVAAFVGGSYAKEPPTHTNPTSTINNFIINIYDANDSLLYKDLLITKTDGIWDMVCGDLKYISVGVAEPLSIGPGAYFRYRDTACMVNRILATGHASYLSDSNVVIAKNFYGAQYNNLNIYAQTAFSAYPVGSYVTLYDGSGARIDSLANLVLTTQNIDTKRLQLSGADSNPEALIVDGVTTFRVHTGLIDVYSGPYSNPPYETDSDYYIGFWGTNDILRALPIGTDSDTTQETFKGSMNIACRYFVENQPTKKVGFVTPFRFDFLGREITDASKLEYVDAMISICNSWGIKVLDLYRTSRLNFMNTKNALALSIDSLHPNALGQEILADEIEAFMRTL